MQASRRKEDPTFRNHLQMKKRRQTIISGMGELHLEIIHRSNAREFKGMKTNVEESHKVA